MRKISLILILALVFALTACDWNRQRISEPIAFYYCASEIAYHTPSAVIQKEIREGNRIGEDILALLNHYLKGPESKELYSPFPYGSEITNCSLHESVLTLDVNSQIANLSGINLTLAMGCLTKTVCSFIDVKTIIIRANSGFTDGNIYRTISVDNFLFSDLDTIYTPPQ